MSRTYKTIGIILKNNSFQENDLLVTFLSPELGLHRAIAPGARKYKSSLRGRTQLFVVNNFLLVKGRNLDRIIQLETQESYPKLSQNIAKLTVSQYLAELVINLALTEQPQVEFYTLLIEYLDRIENATRDTNFFPYLVQAMFHFLILGGIAPEVNYCIETGSELIPNFDIPNWRVGFSFAGGGLINLNQQKLITENKIDEKFTAIELTILQSLSSSLKLENKELIRYLFLYNS